MSPRAAPMAPEERRQAILDAVVPMLLSEGPGLTTKQIAEAAGVAEGTIFRVFPDKRALIQAAAEAAITDSRYRNGSPPLEEGLDLREAVRRVATTMFESHDRVIGVLMALRSIGECVDPREAPARHVGPPEFLVRAQESLLDRLTDLFELHRDELAVPPRKAALVLRALVMGARHPGFPDGEGMTVDDIADTVVDGVTRHAPVEVKSRC